MTGAAGEGTVATRDNGGGGGTVTDGEGGATGGAVATLGAGAGCAVGRGAAVATTDCETGVMLDGVRRLYSAKVTEYSGSSASGSRRYPLGVRFSHQNTAPTAPSNPTTPIVIASPSSTVITASRVRADGSADPGAFEEEKDGPGDRGAFEYNSGAENSPTAALLAYPTPMHTLRMIV